MPSDTLTTLVPDARNSADTTPTLGRADGTGTTCGQLPHRRGREDPPQARLRAGALPRDGRLPELRDLLHDHLDPGGMPHVVLHRLRPGRPGRGQLGLAARRRDEHHRLPRDGGDRVGLPDGRRPLLLVLEARQPRLGLVHRLVQPDRPDRRHGRDRLRPGDVRDGAPELLVRVSEHEGVHLPPLRDLPRAGAGREPDEGQLHGVPEHDLGLLAHRGRDLHRDRAAVRPGQPPVARVRLRRDGECLRLRGRDHELLQPDLLVRVRDRPADGAVHDHGLRRLGAHGRGDDSGLADGRGRHVHVCRRLRRLRVHPARGRDAGDPEHRRCGREPRLPRSLDLDRVDEPELGRGAALHLRRRAVLLRHGVADVGVADAVRLLARRRRPGPPALAAGRQEPRAAAVVRGDRGPRRPQ